MALSIKTLRSKDETGEEMHRLIEKYNTDLDGVKVIKNGTKIPFSALSIPDVYEFVKRIPYRKDVSPVEVVARPRTILRNRGAGMDCKKKAIIIASYLKNRGIPYRLIASSRKPNGRIHHVFPQMGFGKTWMNLDATYSHYRPFQPKKLTRAEVLK